MKKFLKKNNKGFSLVELIVVILIIAIIAVALAPQVIKWVGEASDSTKKSNAGTLKSTVQTVVAECQAKNYGLPTASFTVKGTEIKEGATDKSSIAITNATDKTSSDYFYNLLATAIAGFEDSSNTYTVTVSSAGVVTVSYS